MKWTIILRCVLAIFSGTEFKVSYVSGQSSDELRVPYVPYVVVDKNKDEFDYDRLQDVIVKYLENRSRRIYADSSLDSSTTLYDFLSTSTNAQPPSAAPAELSMADEQYPANVQNPFLHHQGEASYRPRVFKPGATINNKSQASADVKVTTYLPHHYLITPVSQSQTYPANSNVKYRHQQLSETSTPKFVPLKSFPSPPGLRPKTVRGDKNVNSMINTIFGSEMQCSLKSSRYIYDGGCVSKKPVVETVCAERCIKYITGSNYLLKPSFSRISSWTEKKQEKFTKNTHPSKPVVALTCTDDEVRKRKVKLYCKDGTIINNVIRIVDNCLCQEHHEKVHAAKYSRIGYPNSRKRKLKPNMMRVKIRV